jgi:hypothetical protein
MKMEDARFSERNRCEAHEILSKDQKAGADKNTVPESVVDQQRAPPMEDTAACREDTVKMINSSASGDNTHLRLDTVVSIKSAVSESAFVAEEKKDDDDDTPSSTPEEVAPEITYDAEKDAAAPYDVPASEPELAAEAEVSSEVHPIETPEPKEDIEESKDKSEAEAASLSSETSAVETTMANINGAGDVAKEDGEKEEAKNEDEPSEKSEVKAQECDVVLSKEEKEQPAKEEATNAEQEEGGEGHSAKGADGTQDATEAGNMPTVSADGDWPVGNSDVTMPTESVDSDRPVGEPDVTTRQTESVDSDKPMQITPSSASTFDVVPEKPTKMVQFAEDTILTKDGGNKVDTVEVVEPKSELVGFFSCASLCGSAFDAADDGDKETGSLLFKVEAPVSATAISAKPSPTADHPVVVVADENHGKDTTDEEAAISNTVTKVAAPETESTKQTEAASKAEATPDEAPVTLETKSEGKPEDDTHAAVNALDEDKADTNLTGNRAAVEGQPKEEAQPEAEPVAADSSIVADGQRAVDLQQSSTFEVQVGRGCSAFLACGVLPQQSTKAPSNLLISSSDLPHDSIKSIDSHESIFDLREAAERELEERTSQEARLAAESVPTADVQEQCPEYRVKSDEKQTEASGIIPPDERPVVSEEAVPEEKKSCDFFKPEVKGPAAEENGRTIKDEGPDQRPVVSEEAAPEEKISCDFKPEVKGPAAEENGQTIKDEGQPPNQEQSPAPGMNAQLAAEQSVEEPAKSPVLAATAVLSIPEEPAKVEATLKRPSIALQETAQERMPERDFLILAEEENTARKVQQEAYACGCTIL